MFGKVEEYLSTHHNRTWFHKEMIETLDTMVRRKEAEITWFYNLMPAAPNHMYIRGSWSTSTALAPGLER